MKLLTLIYLIGAVLCFVGGIVQCVRWLGYEPFSPGFLLHFIPAAVFFFAYIASQHIDSEAVRLLAIPACIFTLFVWAMFSLAVESFMEATTTVTDVGRYEEILAPCDDSTLLAHFPRPIPPDAEDVKFSFFPGFLQGGAHFQLRYRTSTETIDNLHERFSEMATQSFIIGDEEGRANLDVRMPSTVFYTSGTDDHDFPDDYEMMIFDQLPAEGTNPSWNHGQSHGVAISQQRNEIVYWAEWW